MADPAIVPCAADVWTKVATNVSGNPAGFIHVKTQKGVSIEQTYRDTGGAAPTDLSTAIKFVKPTMEINSSVGIDVYLYPHGKAITVRMDL